MTLSMEARHVLVRGQVQGVGYRAFTRSTAHRLEVVGWVRNLDDGRVEAWLEGAPDAIETLVRALETGPRGARVDAVSAETQPVQGFDDFVMRSNGRAPLTEH